MTPTKKGKATHIRIERKARLEMNGEGDSQRHHVAGGEHKGLVVNKSSQGQWQCLIQNSIAIVFSCLYN